MQNLKKVVQLFFVFTVNFFNAGVFADQFTEDCGRIIDINDYKRCTRKQFTIAYTPDPSSEEALLDEPKFREKTKKEPKEDLKIVVDEPKKEPKKDLKIVVDEPKKEPKEDLKIALKETNQNINTQINFNMTINLDKESVSEIQLYEIIDDSTFKKALKSFNNFQKSDAQFSIKQYLSKNPNSKEGYLLKALISKYDFQDPKQAISDLTMAINLDKNYAEAYSWRAEISAVDFDDYNEALRDINKALEILPDDPLVNFHAAKIYIEIGDSNLEKSKNTGGKYSKDMKELDKGFESFKKSNFYANKAIATYPDKLNDMYQRIFPFGYLYELHHEVGINNYEMAWYWQGDKGNKRSKAKPFFDAAINSFTRAISIAPKQEKTDQIYDEYNLKYLMVADIHFWRGETYQSYVKGAWWKKSCPEYKISKSAKNSEFYKDSQKWYREECY